MNYLVIDYETASACDLKACGSARYSEDPTTEILCLSIRKMPENTVETWLPGQPKLTVWGKGIANRWPFVIHNGTFEKDITRNILVPEFGWEELPDELVHCTLAACALKGIPQGLDLALAKLRLPGKDKAGSRFTVALSKPNRKGFLDRSPEAIARVVQYCESDTEVEDALHRRLGFLDAHERRIYLHNQAVNRRGVKIDLPFIQAAQRVVEAATIPLAKEFLDLTGVEWTQNAAFLKWCQGQGAALENLTKETVETALGAFDDPEDEPDTWEPTYLPPPVKRALQIRQSVNSSSVKKLGRLQQCVSIDGRARNALQYHGTLPGRNAGRLWQPQNFPRGTIESKDPDVLVNTIMSEDIETIEMLFGPPIETVASSLRHALVAEKGHVFLSGDYAGIQARVVLALSGQWNKLELMANGQDIYCDMASQIYKRPITKADKDERQYGKNSVLGLGFGMGAKKFHGKYCEGQPLDFAETIVGVYRKEWAPEVPKLWRALMTASTMAVHTRKEQEAYGLRYRIEDAWLTCTFPGGSKIYYYNPVPTRESMPWDESDVRPGWTFNATKMGKWLPIKAFGGLLTENAVMHIEREIMVNGMLTLEANGFPVVLDVHDEILCEVPECRADLKAFTQIMEQSPDWVKQYRVPLKSDPWLGSRYKK